jgi:hypothetical protein
VLFVRCAQGVHCEGIQHAEMTMNVGTLLLVLLGLVLVGTLPAWTYNRAWGMALSGGLGVLIVIVLVLLLMGRL